MNSDAIDPELDLVLERTVPVAPSAVWDAWTIPSQLMQWFTPRPWRTVACDIDLRPGGVFRTVMKSPEGEEIDSTGCYLAVEVGQRLVFTDALGPGYRPQASPFLTAEILLSPEGEGTRYRAIARHVNAEGRQKHEEMGFMDGWSAALDQLVALVQDGAETAAGSD